jgi:hypothetical protein
MRTAISLIAAAALLVGAAPATGAVKGTPYKGKTTGGHKVTFTLKKNRMWNFLTGVPTTCLPIQGGGSPMTGAEPVNWRWVDLGLKKYEFSDEVKPSFHYNEVTMNHTVSTRRGRNGTVSGAIRLQYQFMIPKYPIGTFTIYSCLGNMKFSARPAR